MKAAIYCRVSTDNQEKEGTSLDSQLAACLSKAKELGYDVLEDLTFIETFSGLRLDRPGLNKMRESIRGKVVDAIIAYTTDRLSRDPVHFIILQEEMEKSAVKLVLVTETVDSSDLGKLISYIKGYAAKLELEKIKERTMRGKRTLVSRGLLPQGTGIGLYGYKWDKQKKKRVTLEYEATVVQKIFTMIAEGSSRNHVAKTLNEQGIRSKSGGQWHQLTIERMITNPSYVGKTYFYRTFRNGTKTEVRTEDEWAILPDVTPAIISEQLFNDANNALRLSKELHHGRPQNDYLLRGHIKCGYCNKYLVGSCLNHKYRYYHCQGTYPSAARKPTCTAGYITATKVEEIAWNKVREIVENPQVILADLQRKIKAQKSNDEKVEKQINEIRHKLEDYDSQKNRLIKLLRHDEIKEDDVLDEINQLQRDKEEDKSRLARLTKLKQQTIDLASVETQLGDFCQKIKQGLDNCNLQTKRLALDILDVQVIATPEGLKIKANIPLEFITIEQTSASLHKCSYDHQRGV